MCFKKVASNLIFMISILALNTFSRIPHSYDIWSYICHVQIEFIVNESLFLETNALTQGITWAKATIQSPLLFILVIFLVMKVLVVPFKPSCKLHNVSLSIKKLQLFYWLWEWSDWARFLAGREFPLFIFLFDFIQETEPIKIRFDLKSFVRICGRSSLLIWSSFAALPLLSMGGAPGFRSWHDFSYKLNN